MQHPLYRSLERTLITQKRTSQQDISLSNFIQMIYVLHHIPSRAMSTNANPKTITIDSKSIISKRAIPAPKVGMFRRTTLATNPGQAQINPTSTSEPKKENTIISPQSENIAHTTITTSTQQSQPLNVQSASTNTNDILSTSGITSTTANILFRRNTPVFEKQGLPKNPTSHNNANTSTDKNEKSTSTSTTPSTHQFKPFRIQLGGSATPTKSSSPYDDDEPRDDGRKLKVEIEVENLRRKGSKPTFDANTPIKLQDITAQNEKDKNKSSKTRIQENVSKSDAILDELESIETWATSYYGDALTTMMPTLQKMARKSDPEKAPVHIFDFMKAPEPQIEGVRSTIRPREELQLLSDPSISTEHIIQKLEERSRESHNTISGREAKFLRLGPKSDHPDHPDYAGNSGEGEDIDNESYISNNIESQSELSATQATFDGIDGIVLSRKSSNNDTINSDTFTSSGSASDNALLASHRARALLEKIEKDNSVTQLHPKDMYVMAQNTELSSHLPEALSVESTELSKDTVRSVIVPDRVIRKELQSMQRRAGLSSREAEKLGMKMQSAVQVSHKYSTLLVKSFNNLRDVATSLQMSPNYQTMLESYSTGDGTSTTHLPAELQQAINAIEKVFEAFEERAPLSPTHYTLMMSTYSKYGMPVKAAIIFDKLRTSDDTIPDTASYNVMLDILIKSKKITAAVRLFEEMQTLSTTSNMKEITPDVITFTTIINALAKIGDKHGALTTFNVMRTSGIKPNVVAWTAVIDAVCQAGDFKAGLRLLHDMKVSGTRPNKATYRAVLIASGREGQTKLATTILHQMTKDSIEIDIPMLCGFIRSYGQAGLALTAVSFHESLRSGSYGPNVRPTQATYNALFEVLADPHSWAMHGVTDSALEVGLACFQQSILDGIFPHPYQERSGSGLVDLRPYTRGAVLFPIHFILNLLISPTPIITTAELLQRVNIGKRDKRGFHKNSDGLATYAGIAMNAKSTYQKLKSRFLLSMGISGTASESDTNQAYSISQTTNNNAIKKKVVGNKNISYGDEDTFTSNISNSGTTSAEDNILFKALPSTVLDQERELKQQELRAKASPVKQRHFPRVNIPDRGIALIVSQEVHAVWSAAPEPVPYSSGVKLRSRQGEDVDPFLLPNLGSRSMRDYVDNVLSSARPSLHFMHSTFSPSVITLSPSTLRFWVTEQFQRLDTLLREKKSEIANDNAEYEADKQVLKEKEHHIRQFELLPEDEQKEVHRNVKILAEEARLEKYENRVKNNVTKFVKSADIRPSIVNPESTVELMTPARAYTMHNSNYYRNVRRIMNGELEVPEVRELTEDMLSKTQYKLSKNKPKRRN